MSIESSTVALRDRTRVSDGGGISAEQFTVPGTDVEVTQTRLLIGGAALVGLLVLARVSGGRDRGGFLIQDV